MMGTIVDFARYAATPAKCAGKRRRVEVPALRSVSGLLPRTMYRYTLRYILEDEAYNGPYAAKVLIRFAAY